MSSAEKGNSTGMSQQEQDPPLKVPLGPDRLVIERRYETISILNDIAIALWFLVGSVLFYFKPLEVWAVSCFVVGSVQFLGRPAIRLLRRIHLKRPGVTIENSGSRADESYEY